jgi:uncharacterized protein YhaN
MILRHLRVENFGCFSSGEWRFAPGVNVIRGPNEAGKSTLAEAIAKVLFGSAPIQTENDEYVRWISWGSSAGAANYRLEAEFEHGGRTWHVVRDFGAHKIELRDLVGSERHNSDKKVRQRLAEMVGLTPEHSERQYLATAYLRQGEWARVPDAPRLDDVIAQAVLSGGTQMSPHVVLGKLKEQHKDYARGMDPRHPAPTNPGRVVRAREKRDSARRKIWGDGHAQGLEARSRAEEKARQDLFDAQQSLAQARAELEILRPRLDAAKRRRELEENLKRVHEKVESTAKRIGSARSYDQQLREDETRLNSMQEIRIEEVRGLEEWLSQAHRLREQAEKAEAEANEAAQKAEQARRELDEATKHSPSQEVLDQARALHLQIAEAESRLHARQQVSNAQRTGASQARQWGFVALALAALLLLIVLASKPSPDSFSMRVLLPASFFAAMVGLWLLARSVALLRAHAVSFAVLRAETEQHQGLLKQRSQLLELWQCSSLEQLAQRRDQALKEASRLEKALEGHERVAQTLRDQALRQRNEADDLEKRVTQQLSQWGVLDLASARSRAQEYEHIKRNVERLQALLNQVLSGTTLQQLEEDLASLQGEERSLKAELEKPEIQAVAMTEREFGELAQRVETLTTQVHEWEGHVRAAEAVLQANRGASEELSLAQAELEEAERELAAAERQERTLGKTIEMLDKAVQQTLALAHQNILPRAEEILERLTLGRYGRLHLSPDAPLRVTVPHFQEPVKADEVLSYATKEQVYLALRLATYLTLWPQGGPPLILDEPLLAFDTDRTEAALQVLSELGANHQVIILTVGHEYDSIATSTIDLQ